jgi:hypothetical protein
MPYIPYHIRFSDYPTSAGLPGSGGSASYVLPIASTVTLGGIKVDGVTTMTSPVTGLLTTIARLG